MKLLKLILSPFLRIINDVRTALNDPNSKVNNCGELDRDLQEIMKDMRNDNNANQI